MAIEEQKRVFEARAQFESAMQLHFMQAYASGEKAKQNGWARVSPFYNDLMRDLYFFAGYDGIPMNELLAEDVN